ncbi:MAG: 2-hydroxychromene-2-carboxylate isomerase [Roseibium sp.]
MTQSSSEKSGSNVVRLRQSKQPVLEFWFEFASTYSYLAAMRIETLAKDYEVSVSWRPFLLGPFFKKQGWDTSPFNLHPSKLKYMWRDMERHCERYGLPLTRPIPFPQNGLLAARIALAGRTQAWIGDYTRAVYMAEFGEGEDISDEALLAGILLEAGAPAKDIMEQAKSDDIKSELRKAVAQAEQHGIFGAPSFILENGELYWGDDRLEDALEMAVQLSPS